MRLSHIFQVTAAIAFAGCAHTHREHEHEHEHEHAEAHEHEHENGHEHAEGHNHDHEHGDEGHAHSEHEHEGEHKDAPGVIVMHNEAAARFGVRTEVAQPGDFNAVVKCAGQVVRSGADDAVASAPTAGIVHFAAGMNPGSKAARGSVIAVIDASGMSGGDANEAAKAQLAAAEAELDRIQDLYDDRLATQGELLAAQAAVAKAKAAYSPSAGNGRVTSPINGTVTTLLVKEGSYVNAGDPIASIGTGEGSVLRADIPQRYYSLAPSFTDMRAQFANAPVFTVSERGGHRLSGAPAGETAISGAYIPVYFTAAGTGMAAGTPFTAYLIGVTRQGVLTVPVSALSEQQGNFFVYENYAPEHYRKLPVKTGASDGIRTEIVSGLEPGTTYVAEGVSAVRLSETSGIIPQGHTHNH